MRRMNSVLFSYLPLNRDPVQVTWMKKLELEGRVDFVHFESNIHKRAGIFKTIGFLLSLIRMPRSVWYACDPYSGFWVGLIAKLKGIDFHYISFELYSEFQPWNRRSKFMRKELELREKLMFRCCHSAYLSNKERAEWYMKKFRIQEEKIFVFENIPTYPDASKVALNPKLADWLENHKVCVYQGSIGSRPIHLFGTVAVFLKRHGYEFLVVSKKTEQIERLVSAHSNIRHEEYMSPSELNEVLARCDLGFACYHSRDKNNEYCAPVKVFDYLKQGLPFIITRHASLAYLKQEFPEMIFDFELDSMEELEESVMKMVQTQVLTPRRKNVNRNLGLQSLAE